jgi:hypothetical protein
LTQPYREYRCQGWLAGEAGPPPEGTEKHFRSGGGLHVFLQRKQLTVGTAGTEGAELLITRRKILNPAYRAAMWCAASSFVRRLTRLSTLMSQRGRAFGCPLILRNGGALGLSSGQATIMSSVSAPVAVPTTRETKSVCGKKIWYGRCNFAARFVNCVLINYPGSRETSVG